MSCPDWSALETTGEPLADDTRAHAVRCPRCYRAALAVDPTLIFRRLPAITVGAGDVAAMKRAVAGMRQTRELTARNHLGRRALDPPRHRRSASWRVAARDWRVAAIAAILALAILGPLAPRLLPPAVDDVAASLAATPGVAADPAAPPAAAPSPAMPGDPDALDDGDLTAAAASAWLLTMLDAEPLIDGVAGSNVIQADYPDLDLVVIVDSRPEAEILDV